MRDAKQFIPVNQSTNYRKKHPYSLWRRARNFAFTCSFGFFANPIIDDTGSLLLSKEPVPDQNIITEMTAPWVPFVRLQPEANVA
ncbi:hypothetical protein SAMN05421510_1001197 [Nitrosomonas ureae]|uniref:Uncharacterized protein n=1 Tax=Nitrosomonas ureae TaxID=44577 RepID=A0A1H8ZS86_9PROT|nr:hypothetical protein SAMN05421510_1001197 [Nitrosomonas ureae]